MNAKAHSARNGPRWFTTAIAIAGLLGLIASATASPPVNEQVAVPKNGINATSQQYTSPGDAHASSANQGNASNQFDVATTFNGDANFNTIAKLANNNGVTDVVAVSNGYNGYRAEFYTGNSDITCSVATAVTLAPTPINTSPPATVGRFIAAIDHARVNPEGGAGFGAVLASTVGTGFSLARTDLGAQATACNA